MGNICFWCRYDHFAKGFYSERYKVTSFVLCPLFLRDKRIRTEHEPFFLLFSRIKQKKVHSVNKGALAFQLRIRFSPVHNFVSHCWTEKLTAVPYWLESKKPSTSTCSSNFTIRLTRFAIWFQNILLQTLMQRRPGFHHHLRGSTWSICQLSSFVTACVAILRRASILWNVREPCNLFYSCRVFCCLLRHRSRRSSQSTGVSTPQPKNLTPGGEFQKSKGKQNGLHISFCLSVSCLSLSVSQLSQLTS